LENIAWLSSRKIEMWQTGVNNASAMLKLVAILSILVKKGSEDIGKNLSRNEFFNLQRCHSFHSFEINC